MTATQLLQVLADRGVQMFAQDDRIRFRPGRAVCGRLREELRRLKPDLIQLLQSPVTAADRTAAYERAVERANETYRAGDIDWPAVDAAADRLFNAVTHGDLQAAVVDYVTAVASNEM